MADIPLDSDAQAAHSSAQPVVHLDALPPGTRLAEFELLDLLGIGGFGLVYRAYDHSLQRQVAIKEYMPAALAARPKGEALSVRSSIDQGTYQSGLKSFMTEARLLARFDHPSLVKVYRFWEANNTAYMAMPLYSGMTLKQARARMEAPPPEDWLRTMLWSVLQALQVLHEHDTTHRDVSPDNIFLQDSGPPVLLDLGAARRTIVDKSRKHTAILKVSYAPIEQYAQAEDLKQGPWSDLYALAAVVYNCLCNEAPPPATARVVRDSMSPLPKVVATVQEHFGLTYSPAFVQAVAHALAVEPAERPQSVQAFMQEMVLHAPERLDRFDWRSALGSALLPEVRAPASLPVDATQVQPMVQTPTEARTQTPARAEDPVQNQGTAESRPASRSRQGLVMGLLVLLAAVLLSVFWFWIQPGEAPSLAAAPAPAAAAASAVAPVPEPSHPGASAPSMVQYESPSPNSKSLAVQHAVVKPALVKPLPGPEPVAAPRELCAKTNFLFKSMCIHQECKKPENAQLPACVEDHQRYPESGAGSP